MVVSLLLHHVITTVIVAVVVVCLSHRASGNMDVLGQEFVPGDRSVPKLGEYVERKALLTLPNSAKRPTVKMRGKERTYESPWLNETINILIRRPDDILPYLGMCKEEAAIYLGILYNEDCMAVDIASKLLFDDRTVIRASFHYFQYSTEELQEEKIDNAANYHYFIFRDKYYVKSRTYGMLEIVLVEMRYGNKSNAAHARSIESLKGQNISSYMAVLKEHDLIPRTMKMVTVSTLHGYEIIVKAWKETKMKKQWWNGAMTAVRKQELNNKKQMSGMKKWTITWYLFRPFKYTLFPFIAPQVPIDEPRNVTNNELMAKTASWNKMGLLEAELRGCNTFAKTWMEWCITHGLNNGVTSRSREACLEIQPAIDSMNTTQLRVHSQRMDFENMRNSKRKEIVKKYTQEVQTQCQDTRRQIDKIYNRDELDRQEGKGKNEDNGDRGLGTSQFLSGTGQGINRKGQAEKGDSKGDNVYVGECEVDRMLSKIKYIVGNVDGLLGKVDLEVKRHSRREKRDRLVPTNDFVYAKGEAERGGRKGENGSVRGIDRKRQAEKGRGKEKNGDRGVGKSEYLYGRGHPSNKHKGQTEKGGRKGKKCGGEECEVDGIVAKVKDIVGSVDGLLGKLDRLIGTFEGVAGI